MQKKKSTKIKLRYIHKTPKFYPAIGRSFPNADDSSNIIEVDEDVADILLRAKVGANKLWEKVKEEPRQTKKEADQKNNNNEVN